MTIELPIINRGVGFVIGGHINPQGSGFVIFRDVSKKGYYLQQLIDLKPTEIIKLIDIDKDLPLKIKALTADNGYIYIGN